MCVALSGLRQAVARYAAGLDADILSVDDARTALAQATAIESTAATIKALAAARVARGGGDTRRRGARSTAHEVAKDTGTTIAAARELLEVGEALGRQPAVRAAAQAGQLSAPQVSLVSGATAVDPAAERRMVEVATTPSLGELRQEASRVKAARVDLEARRADIRARRSLRAWTDTEGVWHMRAQGNPEDGAQVMAALAPITDRAFHAARRAGRREAPDAYAFDALVTLAMEATSDAPRTGSDAMSTSQRGQRRRRRRGAPAMMLLRVDWESFLAGAAREGETCELAGYGPVAMSTVHELLETANPSVAAILTRGKEVVGVAHLGRRPNAHQRSALQWLYPTCARKDCVEQIYLENDHRVDWATTHFTALDLMDRLCRFDHRLKTAE